MLTKEIVIDKIEVLEDGQMQVREATRIFENDVFVSQSFHRHVVEPGNDLDKEDERVANVGAVVHTPEAVAKFDVIRRQREAARKHREDKARLAREA